MSNDSDLGKHSETGVKRALAGTPGTGLMITSPAGMPIDPHPRAFSLDPAGKLCYISESAQHAGVLVLAV